MSTVRALFEFIPLVMALFSLVGLVLVYQNPRRMIDKWILCVAVTYCFLLIVAQSNWIQSLFAGLDTGSPFVEYVWTAFNTTVMFNCLLIIWSHLPRRQ
jgi:hypothetical protein